MNADFENILINVNNLLYGNRSIIDKEDFSDLSGLIEKMIDERSNKVEKELREKNDTYIYNWIKIQTIKDYLAAYDDFSKKMIIQHDDLESEIFSIIQNAMYVQGLRDGLNLLNLAAGNKIKIFKTDVV